MLFAYSVASLLAFVPPPCSNAGMATRHSRTTQVCASEGGNLARRAILTGVCAGAAAAATTPVWAGYVTSLGIETTAPKDADKDEELLGTKQVQGGLENIKTYRSAAASLQSRFAAEQNMPLIPVIRKDFDFSKLRDDLNLVITVFDDTTQLTLDRTSRAILYDLTELENASRFKKGETERTSKKIANVDKWFTKLDKDFAALLAYY